MNMNVHAVDFGAAALPHLNCPDTVAHALTLFSLRLLSCEPGATSNPDEGREDHCSNTPLHRWSRHIWSRPALRTEQGSDSNSMDAHGPRNVSLCLKESHSWTPPTPPPSSSPLRHDSGNLYAFQTTSTLQWSGEAPIPRGSTAYRRSVKPLQSRRATSSMHRAPVPSKPLTPEYRMPAQQSGSDWHSRFTLQCAQRARSERQSQVYEKRNGLVNEIVRPEYESREELAVWKRLALKQKQAEEAEIAKALEDEHKRILQEIEGNETASDVKIQGKPVCMYKRDPALVAYHPDAYPLLH